MQTVHLFQLVRLTMNNFQYERMHVCAQSCLTLCNPEDRSLPGFSVHGIFQARILEWVAISYSIQYE